MNKAQENRLPVFNHVAISVGKTLLGGAGRKDILDFYSSVFGFTEMPSMSRDNELLVLRVYSNEQFIYLAAADQPLRCPATDHFGLSVQTPEQLYETLEKARSYQERDSRVSIEGPALEDFGVLKLHSFYVGYLLPMRLEVQCFEWQEGFDATSLPH